MPDNFGVDQRRGDHLMDLITLGIIIGLHVLFLCLPTFRPVLQNTVFLILDGVAIAAWFVFAAIAWKMTFENYLTWKIIAVILMTVAIVILFFAYGGAASTRALNGGI